MDIVTQSLLGGVLAQSVATREEKKEASLVGVVAGLIADADFFIQSSSDPLLTLEYHRHFTHSLVFIPVGGFLAFLLLWPFLHKRLSVKRLYIFALLGYSFSGILDACTSYGTHLLWPFSDERISWHIISIVDPIFTLILAATFMLGLRFKHRQLAMVGMSLAVVYLGLGAFQMQRAGAIAHELAASRSHVTTKQVVKPTLANLLLWRSTYIANGHIYVDAIRVGMFSHRIYQGESVQLFTLEKDIPHLDKTSALYHDIQRFIVFSDGYVAFDPAQPKVLGDIRYSMLPISAKPLWGIIINKEQPNRHAEYRFFRDNSKTVRQSFINMLFEQDDS